MRWLCQGELLKKKSKLAYIFLYPHKQMEEYIKHWEQETWYLSRIGKKNNARCPPSHLGMAASSGGAGAGDPL